MKTFNSSYYPNYELGYSSTLLFDLRRGYVRLSLRGNLGGHFGIAVRKALGSSLARVSRSIHIPWTCECCFTVLSANVFNPGLDMLMLMQMVCGLHGFRQMQSHARMTVARTRHVFAWPAAKRDTQLLRGSWTMQHGEACDILMPRVLSGFMEWPAA